LAVGGACCVEALEKGVSFCVVCLDWRNEGKGMGEEVDERSRKEEGRAEMYMMSSIGFEVAILSIVLQYIRKSGVRIAM
jgi:hypothetical protein